MPDVILRLFMASWNGLPVASIAVLAVGGFMYLVMSKSTSSGPTAMVPVSKRPGWIARRRARAGISHGRDRIGVGFKSATRAVFLTVRELAGMGAVFGGPGSGKTNFLRLVVEAAAGQQPVVIVDPKGSPALEASVRALGGQVWKLDGKLPVDLMDPRPWQVPDLLLEAEDYSPEARAYRDAAHQRALWAAWALALNEQPMDLAELRRLLHREELLQALEPHRGRDSRINEWIDRLEHQRGGIEDSGARGLDRALGVLLDGVAMRGSLRNCPEALRLEDVLDTNGLVLFSLDAAEYPNATRKVASWVLLAMGRLARQLPEMGTTALLLVDEVGALGSAARHLRGLVGRARESGLAVVLATQGPSDLEAVDRSLLSQVLQDTAWQIVFRMGSPQDAERMQALFGKAWMIDETWSSDGRATKRQVERWRVSIDEFMNALEPGDAWLRVAPIDRGWRQERVRVAMPRTPDVGQQVRSMVSVKASVTYEKSDRNVVTEVPMTETRGGRDASAAAGGVDVRRTGPVALPSAPPECPVELLEKAGADILARVERQSTPRQRELGPCLVWTAAKGPNAELGPYGRIYDAAIGKTDYTHRVVWRRVYGSIPEGFDVDHKCNVALCQRPDHLQLLTKPDNTRKRHQRAATDSMFPQTPTADQRFTVALFAGVDQTTVQSKMLSLEDLAAMLGRFEVLADKRRGRCWSPTEYRPGRTTRSNAGVSAVSALVFDCDRVAPDAERLASVYWLGHTTWSHTPTAPRWRVVIPLTAAVPAGQWRDVWRRARATLCPEADPSCKDPSRQYFLPAHSGGVTAKATRHEGQLLDPSTLPALPPEPKRAELRRSPTVLHPRKPLVADRRRGEAYMASVVGKVAAMPANTGRNNALNSAAWTLGRWVAAGALTQADVEDELYAAAEANGLVSDDGQRQCWATIRSGLSAGLQQPIDLDARD
jgi:hypothetical protein